MLTEQNIEIGTDTPNIPKMELELLQAQTDSNLFYRRMEQARRFWRSQWDGQTFDGRKHSESIGRDAFPWDGAADSRLQTVSGLIREHVTIAKYAFLNAKVQCKSVRPVVQGRDSNKSTKLLQWRIYTHMREELLRELPLAWSWRFGYGVALLGVEWEQQRRLDYQDISLEILDQIVQQSGGQQQQPGGQSQMLMLLDAIQDPAREDDLTAFIQKLSPIVTKAQGRSIIRQIRDGKTAQIPIAYPYTNKPRWTALRPCIDVLFPSETWNIQEARFVARRERISETELRDRIETENYDPQFVEQLVKHKGEGSLIMQQDHYSTEYSSSIPQRSDRDLMDIYHFYHRSIMQDTPCIYKTVFNPMVKGTGGKSLYASYNVFEYEHGQYPMVVMRRTNEERPILSSIGIAEEAYTDEQALKVQQDGLTDRTSLVLNPPMIVPLSRSKSIAKGFGPRAVMEAARPNDINYPPLPPFDQTPIEVINMIMARLANRYALFGEGVDEQFKMLRKQEVANEILGEMELAIEQTFQLMQQYEVDSEVAEVVGPLSRPFHVDQTEILGKHEITATIDMKSIDSDYFKEKFGAIVQVVQTFNQAGTAKPAQIQEALFQMIDPDLADIGLEQDPQTATDKEKADERNAFSQMMNGMEPDKPILGNHQLRMQTMLEEAQKPNIQQRLMNQQDSMELIKNRLEFFQNQIQQHTQNPQIGRALSTQTFQPKMAPQLTTGGSDGQ